MKKVIAFLLLAGSLLSHTPLAVAAAPAWRIDPAHSSFNFDVRHIYATIRGFFADYGGTVRFDPADLEGSAMAFQVEVKSIQTRVSKRDNHLRSPDFFDAKQYPVITFASTSIIHMTGNQYEMAGRLTIKDKAQDVVLPLTYFGTKGHPLSPKELVAGFDTQITIDRLAYGVGTGKFFELGIVGREVKIVVSLELLRDKE